MIPCKVKQYFSCWLVTFFDSTTLLLQSDIDQVNFAVDCGKIKARSDWDGRPSTLPKPDDFYRFQCSDITECPDDYLAFAEKA